MNIVVLHGPNLNLLGERPSDEPKLTLDALNQKLRAKARVLELSLRVYQSNHEGALIDHLHNERKWADAFVINPGALTHYSYALRDAIAAVQKPCIEVHLTDLSKREAFRKTTVLADVVKERIIGKGIEGYMEAFEVLDQEGLIPRPHPAEALRGPVKSIGKVKVAPEPEREEPPASKAGSKKTIGRKAESEESKPSGKPDAAKSLGRAAQAGAARDAAAGRVTRPLVRQKIADRLSGKLTPAALSTWARTHWAEVQGGAATEAGQREILEDTLQALMLATQPKARLTDDQLVELMTQLD